MEAFYAVLPVFLLIAVGAAVHMTDVLPENTGAAMGLYVLKLALPVLMLHILSGASRLDLAHGGFWLGVIGAQMLCYLLGYAVDRLFSRRGTGPAIISGLACSASNTAFVGLPIVAGLLPGNHEAMVVAGLAALTPNVVVIMAQIRMDCLAGSAAWGDGRGRIWKLLRLFLLGAKPGVAEQAGENLKKRYPDLLLCGTHDGYFQTDDPVVDQIRAARADVVFVCLGAPKQERWMAQYGPETGAHLMVGLGGVLDVYAGHVKRAPEIWQKLGLEWCYRLLHQPSRLGRMAKLPLFLLEAAREKGKRGKP